MRPASSYRKLPAFNLACTLQCCALGMHATTDAPAESLARIRCKTAQGSYKCSRVSPNTQQLEGNSVSKTSSSMVSMFAAIVRVHDEVAIWAYSGSISMPMYSQLGLIAK